MAVGKWKAFDFLKKYALDGTVDFDTNAMKVAAFLSTSNINTLSVGTGIYGDITNEVATANGYTVGGVSLVSPAVTRSGATTTFSANDLTPAWTAAGGNIVFRFLGIYVNATVNGIVKPMLAVSLADTTPADITVVSGNPLNLTLTGGIYTLTGATTD